MLVPIRFRNLVLGLLCTLLALTHQAMGTMVVTNGNGLEVTAMEGVPVDKELFGVPTAAAAASNERLGGRKFVVDKISRKEMMKEEGINERTSKFSGKDKNTLKKSFGTSKRNRSDQDNRKMLKPNSLNSASMKIPGSEPVDHRKTNQLNSLDFEAISTCGRLKCFSGSKISVSQESHVPFQKNESQKLVEVVNEMVNLMDKDYKGTDKARRKPPINNHEPLDEEDVEP